MPLGKFLIVSGIILLLAGLFLTLGHKFPFPLGRLPGDIFIQKDKFSFSFPIATCLLLSLLLTLILNLFFHR